MLKNNSGVLELLAPAKDVEQGCAAILCGADALYVGAPQFGARSAAGVSIEQLGELCRFAHRYRARVYVAMNTILFEEELVQAEQLVHQIWEAGADALIVQDLSFLRMSLPPIELHASTQMFNADPLQVKFLGEVGFTRVILERALNLSEIGEIAQAGDVEIEAFVHGAICVSHSGRCYMSRTTGPRSGNRGVCAQSCRLPYNLVDENLRLLVKDRHLLSVQDLNLSDHLEAMIDAGVTSFKIEGRLKDMTYVRNVVGWYRHRLDEIIERRGDLSHASLGVSVLEFEPDPAKSFARGATPYYIRGLRDDVASFDTPKSLGEYIGTVQRVQNDCFELEGDVALSSGDGICFLGDAGKLVGTHVNRVEGKRIYPNRMDSLSRGMEIFRNHDRLFVAAVERSRLRRTIPLTAHVEVTSETIILTVQVDQDQAQVTRTGRFDAAQQPQKAEETLRTQLAKMGDTIYTVSLLEVAWDQARFVPISLLNELRREATTELDRVREAAYTRRTRRAENGTAPYPKTTLSGADNVTNTLAERFYRDHGVQHIEPGYDLSEELIGCTVMEMRYCIRREMGECLTEGSAYTGKLLLENGLHLYELQFDCARCAMQVIYRGRREKIIRQQSTPQTNRQPLP